MTSKSKWETVGTYGSLYEAEIAAGRLEDSGIPSRLDKRGAVGLFGPGFEGKTVRGVAILVPTGGCGAAASASIPCGVNPESTELPPEGAFPVDGAKLHYTITGKGPVTLVVIPGGPGFGFGYLHRELTELLGDSYQLLFYDQRGSGHSTGVEDTTRLTMATFVDDLDQVRRAAGLHRLNLLGHSFGGLLAMQYAIAHPGRVASLVLVDSDPASRERWSRFRTVVHKRRTEDEARQLSEIKAIPGWELRSELAERFFRISLRPYFGNPALAERLTFEFDEHVLRNNAVTAGCAPTLIIAGDSGIFSVDDSEAVRRRIPNAKLEILEGVGHLPYVEAPEKFASAVRTFLPTY